MSFPAHECEPLPTETPDQATDLTSGFKRSVPMLYAKEGADRPLPDSWVWLFPIAVVVGLVAAVGALS